MSELVTTLLAWLGLAIAIAYCLEVPWRRWRNRPGKWGPPFGEILLPVIFVLAAITRGPAMTVRILAAVLFCGGAMLRWHYHPRAGRHSATTRPPSTT